MSDPRDGEPVEPAPPRSNPGISHAGAFQELLGLVEFVKANHEALEADFLRYYHQDLLDVYRGRMSWRRVKVLINALPADAALFRSMDDHGGWTITDHLLASVIDGLGVASYHALVGPHADPKKLRSVKPPERTYRPGVVKTHRKNKRPASSEDLKRIFGGSASYRPKGVN